MKPLGLRFAHTHVVVDAGTNRQQPAHVRQVHVVDCAPPRHHLLRDDLQQRFGLVRRHVKISPRLAQVRLRGDGRVEHRRVFLVRDDFLHAPVVAVDPVGFLDAGQGLARGLSHRDWPGLIGHEGLNGVDLANRLVAIRDEVGRIPRSVADRLDVRRSPKVWDSGLFALSLKRT